MTITDAQMSNLRLDAGLADDETIFTNVELSTIWERLSGASSDTTRHEAALGLMFRQILASAVKLNDYAVATSSEKKSQVFEHLKTLYALYKPSLEEALDVAPNPIALGSMRRLEVERDQPRGVDEDWDRRQTRPPDDFT